MTVTVRSALEYLILLIPLYIFILNPLISSYLTNTNTSNSATTYISKNASRAFQYYNTTYTDTGCPQHTYTTTLLSRTNPLMLLIPNFLSSSEIAAIKAAATPHWTASPVYHGNVPQVDASLRNSQRAPLPDTHVFRCIAARAMALQGWPVDTHIEPLWAQKYEAGGFYDFHYDWESDVVSAGGGRVSTFMVYVDCEECEGGGTHFPRLDLPGVLESSWCGLVECAEGDERVEGTVVRPVPGMAVYWENFGADGVGLETTLHRALEVKKGRKIGLNVWSWYQPGSSKERKQQTEDGKHVDSHGEL